VSNSDIGRRGNYGVLFRNGAMDFAGGLLLGYASQAGLSPGALLGCFRRIRSGSPGSWASVFREQARADRTRAEAAEASGRLGEASGAWLATCVGERAALMMMDPSTADAAAATEAMEAAFGSFLRAGGVPLAQWPVPFRDGHLPAYVSRGFERASVLLVVIGGGDTYVEDLWFFGAKAAHEAGWPVLMVDLPGQGSTPRQGFHFGPATLDGLRTVMDAVRARGFAGDVVLLGWSGGGIFVTKFASLARPDDQLRAWIASAPIYDAQSFFAAALPSVLRRDPSSVVLRAILWAVRRNPVLRASLAKYDWQFGPGGIAGVVNDFADLGRTDLGAIHAPVLALVGLGEDAESLRQAQEVVDAVGARFPDSDLITFDATTGADSHCQVGNLPLAMIRALGWLERIGVRP
jgi:alpha-beta hydrolase superfamily lysophospholipase